MGKKISYEDQQKCKDLRGWINEEDKDEKNKRFPMHNVFSNIY